MNNCRLIFLKRVLSAVKLPFRIDCCGLSLSDGVMAVYRHFGARTLRHQCRSVHKTLRHYFIKIVLHLRISESCYFECDKLLMSDHDSIPLVFSGKHVDPLSPSVFAVICRLFEVNRMLSRLSLSKYILVISTRPLPVKQGMHYALQLLIVIISD